MKILGIDPSLRSTGYGIIEQDDRAPRVIKYGVIKPSQKALFLDKLNEIKTELDSIIKTYGPDEIAIENLFYARNIKTAITLGQVRGAVLIAVASNQCPLYEYSALEIKKAVTGYGRADKNQVQIMIKTLLHIQDENMEEDASDALAAAFCHLNSRIFLDRIKGT
ncbi:MAG: crossover junction endodeoxyribonuclease RuvC [Candidatus Aminicenantes bacterium]|nr:crossover junction endodeoxyribonuclease RuvC [Candidatus Aminicenantes bacterium]